MSMRLRFWGVRGSIPVPGASTQRVGGNTTCVSVEYDGYTVVFDAGTGIRQLGHYLERQQGPVQRGCIFLSHYHWDHIQGLPFFQPAFRAENRFHLFGEHKKGVDLHDILNEQMQTPYFPVPMDAQEGLMTFNAIEAGQRYELPHGIVIDTLRLRHPNDAVGFRISSDDGSVCIVTDHEHSEDGIDESVVAFARDADLLIHEAPYEPDEKRTLRQGWGHSSWQEAAEVAAQADVGRLFLSHHDPERTDDELIDVLARTRAVFERSELATEMTSWDVPARQ